MTHRESDKRMTKEREAEIRTPCIGYEPQEHVKELLAELDAVREERDEVKTKKPNRSKRDRHPWFIILELLKDMTVEERTRCLRATAAFFKVKL